MKRLSRTMSRPPRQATSLPSSVREKSCPSFPDTVTTSAPALGMASSTPVAFSQSANSPNSCRVSDGLVGSSSRSPRSAYLPWNSRQSLSGRGTSGFQAGGYGYSATAQPASRRQARAALAPAMVGLEPFGEARQPGLERRRRREADGAAERGGVGVGRFHVARLHRLHFQLRFLPQGLFQGGDVVEQAHRRMVAD